MRLAQICDRRRTTRLRRPGKIALMVERKSRPLELSKRVLVDLRRDRQRPVVRPIAGFECARVHALMRAPLR